MILFLVLIPLFFQVSGQEKKQNYGNMPDELVAFDKYQKAHKYHFLVPIQFYGAGRELKPPSDTKTPRFIRINFCDPRFNGPKTI